MPKAANRKPAPTKPAAKPAGTKAQQAAAHQGRTVPAEPKKPQLTGNTKTQTQVQPSQNRNLPAQRQSGGAVVDPSAVQHLPAHMRGDAGAGLAGIGSEDMEIPRLKLMQGLSPELQEFNDLRIGNFFHPAAEFIFNKPFLAVPIYTDKRYILWNPRESGGGILARADDAVHWSPQSGEFTVTLDKKDGGDEVTWKLAPTVQGSGLANWGTMNPNDPDSPPAATLMYNFLLAFPDEPDLMPAVMTFQRTSIGAGRKFLTKLKTQRAPIFGTIWEFSANEEHKNNNNWYTIGVKGAGLVEDEALYQQYRAMHEQFTGKGLSIKDIEGLQGDGGDDNTGQDGNGDGDDGGTRPTY